MLGDPLPYCFLKTAQNTYDYSYSKIEILFRLYDLTENQFSKKGFQTQNYN